MQTRAVRFPSAAAGWLILITLAALSLRLLRLEWQPLWWDEGYSVYFATEPLARMVWLTARDIHPPFYFAVAHAWASGFSSTTPVTFRLLSIVAALPAIPLIALLANRFAPGQTNISLAAALLMALSPMHLYYSHEVRMYGLALTCTLAATIALFSYRQRLHEPKTSWRSGLTYALLGALSLYTLYYSALLLAAHALWSVYLDRSLAPRARLIRLWPFFLLPLFYLPWLLYAIPQLVPYVQEKVVADEHSALNPLVYLWMHLVAFTGGHLNAANAWTWPNLLRYAGLLAPLAAAWTWWQMRHYAQVTPTAHPAQQDQTLSASALWFFVLIPVSLGFAVNLLFPFFPTGGERLLLIILPYFLLLILFGSSSGLRSIWRYLPATLLASAGLAGIWIFYTSPRYINDDYRPLIADVITYGRDQDEVLAIFPWQIGYWRAYAPRTDTGELLGPQPAQLDQEALVWNTRLQSQIEVALTHGTVWFPAPLGFGSSLPLEIEAYLSGRAANLLDSWYSPTTRLSAWSQTTMTTPVHVVSGALEDTGVRSANVDTLPVPSANEPLAIRLTWTPGSETSTRRVLLRLVDQDEGHVWSMRSYEPAGRYAAPDAHDMPIVDEVGLLIPAGLAPRLYTLEIAVLPLAPAHVADNSATAINQPPPVDDEVEWLSLTEIQVVLPQHTLDPHRLRVSSPPSFSEINKVASWGNIGLMGIAKPTPTAATPAESVLTVLAGTEIQVQAQLQAFAAPATDAKVALELRSPAGAVVAANTTWPYPQHPPQFWPVGSLISAPTVLFIPGYLDASAEYTLWAGIETETGRNLQQVAPVSVMRRSATFEIPLPLPGETWHMLSSPVQYGTHVLLLGYSYSSTDAEPALRVLWQVIQPIVPPHHIFVHLLDTSNEVVYQRDGEPVTVEGPAPSGSWFPDEYILTHHSLPDALNLADYSVRIGFYAPASEQRLPASQEAQIIGDFAELILEP